MPEHQGIIVHVIEPLPDRIPQSQAAQQLPEFLLGPSSLVVVVHDSRRMRHAVPDGDPVLAVDAEFRKVVDDRIVRRNLALIDDDGKRRRGTGDLRDGREVEQRVEGDFLLFGIELPIAVPLEKAELIAAADRDDRAGRVADCDRLLDDRVDVLQARRIHAHGLRLDPLEPVGRILFRARRWSEQEADRQQESLHVGGLVLE